MLVEIYSECDQATDSTAVPPKNDLRVRHETDAGGVSWLAEQQRDVSLVVRFPFWSEQTVRVAMVGIGPNEREGVCGLNVSYDKSERCCSERVARDDVVLAAKC